MNINQQNVKDCNDLLDLMLVKIVSLKKDKELNNEVFDLFLTICDKVTLKNSYLVLKEEFNH